MATNYAISQAIPGLPRLTAGATSIINNALTGLPSPSESRLSNAYFGAGSGLDPTSDFLRNRGFDLYKRDANARQQQGLQDLFSMIGTYSGNVAPTPGQEMADAQQTAQLQQQGQQFGATMGFEQQQWQKQLELLNQFLKNPGGGTGTYAGGGGLAPGSTNMAQRYAGGFGGTNNTGSSYVNGPSGVFLNPGETTGGKRGYFG